MVYVFPSGLDVDLSQVYLSGPRNVCPPDDSSKPHLDGTSIATGCLESCTCDIMFRDGGLLQVASKLERKLQ